MKLRTSMAVMMMAVFMTACSPAGGQTVAEPDLSTCESAQLAYDEAFAGVRPNGPNDIDALVAAQNALLGMGCIK